ncbi:DNA-protecting protein DprA [Neolewinella aurantiaca]|uniref:DNA-protecting protein DprA n=1 Tax=Neolewinella aurantiaca TaxID=2602767 RepID=A0A5C7FHT0_9BACT|nr:DNA-processing protein DprA [Neolewinella aurantiaca]TXF89374.1 DNA-protecting protein DprA [Neolewinella aurantiaca]
MHPDTFSRLALSRMPNIGPKLFRNLIQHFISAEEVFRARTQELCEVAGIAQKTADSFGNTDRAFREAETIIRHAERHDISVLCCLDDNFPSRMQPHTGAAPILYYYGEADLNNPRTVAVVGTREMSSNGARQIERILDPLTNFSPLIVSGLAYGVDIYAHRRCLQAGLPTLAVMGSGFDRIYPQAHAKTALRMAENGGGVLTAYPFWSKPEKDHFPARNRVVAMLSDLTVVVESAARGGSMITARMAHDLGKKVGACPGRGGDPLTEGCNNLIKTGKAHLIESADDIIGLLGWKGHVAGRQQCLFKNLDPSEQALIDQLRDRDGVEIDELRFTLQQPPAQLASLLLMLEMKGIIAALPGHRYRLC